MRVRFHKTVLVEEFDIRGAVRALTRLVCYMATQQMFFLDATKQEGRASSTAAVQYDLT